jgi:general secretion pathway protein M
LKVGYALKGERGKGKGERRKMNWFNQLTSRERRTLMIGTVMLGGILFYFLVWEPFVTARTQLENIVASQQSTLQWMNDAAAEVQQLQQRPQTKPSKKSTQSIISLIDKSTRIGALRGTNKRIEAKGQQEVRVTFEEVSFTDLMRWLKKLYNQHQIQISTISIEQKHKPDKVKVRLTLNR